MAALSEEEARALEEQMRRANSGVSNEFVSGLNISPEQALGLISLLPAMNNYSMQATQLRDTTGIQNQIDEVSRAGSGNYYDYNQIGQEMAGIYAPRVKHSDVSAMSSGQRAGNVLGQTAQMAAAGSTFGPVGGILGGVAGFAKGLIDNLQGSFAEDVHQEYLNLQARKATQNMQNNFAAATENLSDRIARNRSSNVAANGGQIQRKQLSAKDFADVILKRKALNDVTRSSDIMHKRCNGGLMVRIKK